MVRKILGMSLICLSMVFLMQCSDDPFNDGQETAFIKKGPGGGGGGHNEPVGNNLSFPVFAMDGFSISSVQEALTVEYDGPYDGLTPEEITYLAENGPWYAQKTVGNVWQATYDNGNVPVSVTFIDWGDVIESTNPVAGRPFRLETTLYVDISDAPMDGYMMALLANPSSPDEIQGTNGIIYAGYWATVASLSPTMIIQALDPGAEPVWNQVEGMWTGTGVHYPIINFRFAPELNVGGKYIYGASQGGWRPTAEGLYRLTFFMPGTTNISLAGAVIGNYAGNTADQWGTPETKASAPVVDDVNNLTYVDVTVVRRR